jgi:hypothetical protein
MGIDDSVTCTLKRNNTTVSKDVSFKIKDSLDQEDYGSQYASVVGKKVVLNRIPDQVTTLYVDGFLRNKKVSESTLSMLNYQVYTINTYDPMTKAPKSYLSQIGDVLMFDCQLNNNPITNGVTFSITGDPMVQQISNNEIQLKQTPYQNSSVKIHLFINDVEITNAAIEISIIPASGYSTQLDTSVDNNPGFINEANPIMTLKTFQNGIDVTSSMTYAFSTSEVERYLSVAGNVISLKKDSDGKFILPPQDIEFSIQTIDPAGDVTPDNNFQTRLVHDSYTF